MYDLERALELWDEAGRYGSVEKRIERGRLWLPYYSYLANRCLGEPYHASTQAQRVSEFMLQEDILRSSYTLLDVGAGTGAYSIEFAKRCVGVTTLDMNGDSLAVLRDRARQCGLGNINVVNAPWEEYRNEDKFDVAFSAMCPAICNQEELLRLESITEHTACLLTVTCGSYEKHRKQLMRQLLLKKPEGMVTEALHYYNVLYLMGRQPSIKTWSEQFESRATVGELMERYSVYLKIFGMNKEDSQPFLQDYFARYEHDGIVSDECRMNTALIYWTVPETEP